MRGREREEREREREGGGGGGGGGVLTEVSKRFQCSVRSSSGATPRPTPGLHGNDP